MKSKNHLKLEEEVYLIKENLKDLRCIIDGLKEAIIQEKQERLREEVEIERENRLRNAKYNVGDRVGPYAVYEIKPTTTSVCYKLIDRDSCFAMNSRSNYSPLWFEEKEVDEEITKKEFIEKHF